MPVKVERTCDTCGKILSYDAGWDGKLDLPRIHNSFFAGTTEVEHLLTCKDKACLASRLQQIIIEYKLLEPKK